MNKIELAKALITDFIRAEYDQEPDFSDLSRIPVAFTTAETDEYQEIQAYVNLADFCIETHVDGICIRQEQYQHLHDLITNGLWSLSFEDLVFLSNEELERIERS